MGGINQTITSGIGVEGLLRKGQVAALLGVCGKTVERMVRAGRFPPPIRLGARGVRWTPAAVERWIEAEAGRG